jgi:hypothetical protein
MFNKKIIFLSLFSLSWCLGGEKAFAGPTFFIQVTNTPIQPRYFHNYSTSQIESMRHTRFHNNMMHNPGITVAEHELKTDYQLGGIQRGGGQYHVWAESVHVDFSYNQMDVYVSSQYPEGSCPYQVILWHENQHVSINTRALAQYKNLIESALKRSRNIPTKAHPIMARSMNEGGKIIAARINQIVTPLYSKFKMVVLRENAKIDTIANYRRTQAKCKQW